MHLALSSYMYFYDASRGVGKYQAMHEGIHFWKEQVLRSRGRLLFLESTLA